MQDSSLEVHVFQYIPDEVRVVEANKQDLMANKRQELEASKQHDFVAS